MYALVVKYKFGDHYTGIYNSIEEVVSTIRKIVPCEEISDLSTPEKIKDTINSTHQKKFSRDLKDGTRIAVYKLTRPIIPKVIITIEDGVIRNVTGNSVVLIIVRNKDLNSTEGYVTEP